MTDDTLPQTPAPVRVRRRVLDVGGTPAPQRPVDPYARVSGERYQLAGHDVPKDPFALLNYVESQGLHDIAKAMRKPLLTQLVAENASLDRIAQVFDVSYATAINWRRDFMRELKNDVAEKFDPWDVYLQNLVQIDGTIALLQNDLTSTDKTRERLQIARTLNELMRTRITLQVQFGIIHDKAAGTKPKRSDDVETELQQTQAEMQELLANIQNLAEMPDRSRIADTIRARMIDGEAVDVTPRDDR